MLGMVFALCASFPIARAGDSFVFAYASRTRLERLRTFVTGR